MSSSEAHEGTRRFIVLGHEAITHGDFALNDLAGATGRLDVLLRCVNSAFMLSHDLRRDTELDLVLLGPPRPPVTLHLVGADLKHLNPDERSTAALLRKALRRPQAGLSSPGIHLRFAGLSDLLADLPGKLVYLREDGEDLRRAPLGPRSTFLLSDHQNLEPEEEQQARARGPRIVSLGPRSLHADHAILLVHNELDRRSA